MKLIRRLLVLGAALAVVLMAFAPAAHADPINYLYYFSGANLNFANVPPCCTDPWGASNAISGYLELSAELPTNAEYFNNSSPMTTPLVLDQFGGNPTAVSLLGYSFTDGITTFTTTNSTVGLLDLKTIGSTTIDYWSIDLNANQSGGFVATLDIDNEGEGTSAYEKDSDGIGVQDLLESGGDGSFSNPEPEVTPEPATWALFGTGALALLGLAVLERRRRPAASV